MNEIVEVPLESGGTLMVETSAERPDRVTRGGPAEDAITTGTRTLEESLGSVAPAARTIIERLRDAAAPSEIALEFGLTVNASTGMILASSGVNANIKVSLTWKTEEPE